MTLTLKLPGSDAQLETYRLSGRAADTGGSGRAPFNRIAYSAAHVVVDPLADIDPSSRSVIDWDATIA